jgi:transcriptional regulator
MSKPSDLIQGTLDLLILRTLALQSLHGWAIARRIQQVNQDVLQITQGALYPALHRVEQQGWLRAEWRSETGREAKFYALTRAGRAQLEKQFVRTETLPDRPWRQEQDYLSLQTNCTHALRTSSVIRGWNFPRQKATPSRRSILTPFGLLVKKVQNAVSNTLELPERPVTNHISEAKLLN